MFNAVINFPKPASSPFISFAKGTPERAQLEKEIEEMVVKFPRTYAIPLWIGEPIYIGSSVFVCAPHDLSRNISHVNQANKRHVIEAINMVLDARKSWAKIPWELRLQIFQQAARLIETKYMIKMVFAVMEDYSKNPYEAFIDVQELVDFLNYGVYYASQIYSKQPQSNRDMQNFLDYRPLEGFVFAASPNNFLAINGNLACAPLIMGNVVIAKPPTEVAKSYNMFLNILLESGLPHNVLAVLYGDEEMIGDMIFEHPSFSGLHFTGSTETFIKLSQRIANNLDKYHDFPRVVGETGGKDWLVVYDDHDPVVTATAIVGGGFGAQGRKCSSTSRVYITHEMWQKVFPIVKKFMLEIKVGDVTNLENYVGALINKQEYDKVTGYLSRATQRFLHKDEVVDLFITPMTPEPLGHFIQPTIIVTNNPHYETMVNEVFGPVVTVYPMAKDDFEKNVLQLCNETSKYGLTGAIHTRGRQKFYEALEALRYAAGNVYNKWTTGALVDLQPFSGARKSGTNSKVGWDQNLYQWVSPRTIGLTHNLPTHFAPPYLK